MSSLFFCLVVAFAICLVLSKAEFTGKSGVTYPEPGPTLDPKPYTKWDIRRSDGSRKAIINIPVGSDGDFVKLYRLDLVGDARAKGFAHGALMTKEIIEFMGPKLDKYIIDMVMDIDISKFPEPLQKIFNVIKIAGAAAAPGLFHKAMSWVYDKEVSYMPQNLIDEMEGIAEGMCSTLGSNCDVAAWSEKIKSMNMFPELIRMACTAYGAWGKATPTDTLVQVRALDFGGGPFANYTMVNVYRDDNLKGNSFVSVTFPGFVGVITGVSQRGIGVSEKVWMTYDTPSIQPGSYDGEPDVFVLRDILEKHLTRESAEEFLAEVKRTWSIWIGIGDHSSKKFDLVGYKQDSTTVYTDVTAPSATGQPYIPSVAYVDKHPQPTGEGPTGTLPTALQDFYGNITLETAKTINKYHQTGDLHIATYDFGSDEMYLAIGKIDGNGEYGNNKAFNRPYVKFSLQDLWTGR